ncbi:hypothetical protein JR338_08355 [Chloroflexota bacterium]|nr:hypothetical protein JR338_08355 [Chloroflexota bacterium]
MNKRLLKNILGRLPYTVELYWELVQRHRPWSAHYNLDDLAAVLPEAVEQTAPFAASAKPGKKVFVFASLHYWIDFSTLLGLALAGKGHDVTLSFLPYANWDKPIQKFDLRKQNLYTREVLSQVHPLMQVQSLLDVRPFSRELPSDLRQAVEAVSVFDTQYTLQVEDITREEEVYKIRQERNLEAARNARAWLLAHKPDVVVIPNGTILEMGAVYQVAKHLNIPVVTFEFGDQRERIWIAQDAEIMHHETDELWGALGDQPLTEDDLGKLQALFSARQDAKTWKNFARQWQDTPTEGGKAVRKKLGLDDRPVVLLATNVLGDSLTLGRQVFSESMAEWIERTVKFFAEREDVQLVIRVHPGEMLIHGTSMVDVVKDALGEIPPQIHLVGPEEKVNTYDITDITDLGLVYTTTVGLEMALRGIPVVVAGQTHYRNRGFTQDPASWDTYSETLNVLLADLKSARLTEEQVELAWRYAYLFFFAFPKPFPWHLLDLKSDIKERPLSFVLGDEGTQRYGETLAYLTGKPLVW